MSAIIPMPNDVPARSRLILSPSDLIGLKGRIGLDVETTEAFQPHLGELVGVGVYAYDMGIYGYVPCYQNQERQALIKLAMNTWQAGSWLLMHNGKYELHWLDREYDWVTQFKLFDTIVAEHLINENYYRDLGWCERRHLKTRTKEYYLEEGKQYGGIKKIHQWPVELQAAYCANDCRITVLIAQKQVPMLEAQRLMPLMRQQMAFLPELYDSERYGALIDRARLEESLVLIDTMIRTGQDCLDALTSPYGVSGVNVNSPTQLSKLLYQVMGLPKPVIPESLKGSKQAAKFTETATGKDLLKGLNNPVADEILELRGIIKTRGFLESWVELEKPIDSQFSTLHSNFKQTGTETGRLSSAEPNMQQVTKKAKGAKYDPRGKGITLRPIIIPRPGNVMVSIDYKQMEVAVFALLAQIPEMIDMIRRGVDIHKEVAELLFGFYSEDNRTHIKNTNFGVLYGLGIPALAKILGLSEEATARLYHQYITRFNVRPFLEFNSRQIYDHGYVTYWSGRRRRISDRNEAYKAVNAVVQGGCADILSLAYTNAAKVARQAGGRIIFPIHDEIVADLPMETTKEATREIREIMSVPHIFGIPLNTDCEVGPRWYEDMVSIDEWAPEGVKALA